MSVDRAKHLRETIASIDEQLNAGATSMTAEGQSAAFDLAHLQRRRAKLARELDQLESPGSAKPSYFRTVTMD